MSSAALSRRAVKDLARIARVDRKAAATLVEALEALGGVRAPDNLDVKTLEGRPPWLRLRVSDWRVIYRALDDDERAELSVFRGESVERGTVYVERVVNRRDLERILAALP